MGLEEILERAFKGEFDSGLASHDIASLAIWLMRLRNARDTTSYSETRKELTEKAVMAIRTVYEELSRPIDTIRHQAKTVTVGTTRPESVLAPVIRHALTICGLSETQFSEQNHYALSKISKLVGEVLSVASFSIKNDKHVAKLVFQSGNDKNAQATYSQPNVPIGILELAMDQTKIRINRAKDNVLIVMPFISLESNQSGLIQFRVHINQNASREDKTAVLKALGVYNDLLQSWENSYSTLAEDKLLLHIAETDPETVLCRNENIKNAAQAI